MKVSTKIILGYSLLVLLMAGGIGYELLLIQRMEEVNRRLSEVNVQSSRMAARLAEDLRNVADFTSRYLQINDPRYASRLEETRQLFEANLDAMFEVARSEADRDSLARLEDPLARLDATWGEFLRSVVEIEMARPAGTHDFFPPRLDEQIGRMEAQVEAIARELDGAVDAEVALSAEASRQAQRISWAVAAAAVGLAGGIGLSMARSIRGSFQKFREATASVAAGEFGERLPEHREDEFGELARSFNAMAARLEELDRLKKDFVSSVSHELKSPIASSREIVQLLLDEIPGPINPEQRRLLELSIRSSRRLSAMVGGLLDLARMDAGVMRYDMERCDLRGLVQSTLEESEAVARDRGLRIEAALDRVGPISCDRDRIVQVVGNLVDNAMKFSSRGSVIAVRLESIADGNDPQSKSGVMFSIIDAGPGVDDHDKKRIFAKFQQVRPEGSKQKGVGLGLAICRSIVEDHGGRIWVEDNPRGGAVFRFVLPSILRGAGHADPARVVGV